jgi:hypothetical protein
MPAGNRSVTATPLAALGPALSSVTVHIAVSPTVGVGSDTATLTRRSALVTDSVTDARLFATTGSPCTTAITAAVSANVAPAAPGATVARSSNVVLAPLASVPTVQLPVVGAKLPWLGVLEAYISAGGRWSASTTPVAASGPLFASVTVNVTRSPTSGNSWSAASVTASSALGTAGAAIARSFDATGSPCDDAVTEAVSASVKPAALASTVTRSNSVTLAPLASDPTFHVPVDAA